MAQHDYDLANAAGASFRADANNALQAIATNNSGNSEPTTTFPYQWWADTTSGILKQRNAANSAWIDILTLSTGFCINANNATNLSGGAAGNIPIQSAAGTTVFYTGQIAGTRNKLINGAMGIDQRNAGAAQTITAGAALAYTVDRWYAYCTGANVTGQRVAGTAPNKFNYRFTGAASVTKIGFAQRIEAANCQDLAGQTATLSVDLANSLLTTVTWTAWYANTEDTFGTLASPTRTQIATGTFTVSSTLARYSTQISIPSAATTGIEVEFSVGAQTSGTWTIGRAQLEVGGVATAFEYRDVGDELRRCQRYYWAIPVGFVQWGGYGVAGNVYTHPFKLPVAMRANPALDYKTPSTTNCSISGDSPSNEYIAAAVTVTANGPFTYSVASAGIFANAEL